MQPYSAATEAVQFSAAPLLKDLVPDFTFGWQLIWNLS